MVAQTNDKPLTRPLGQIDGAAPKAAANECLPRMAHARVTRMQPPRFFRREIVVQQTRFGGMVQAGLAIAGSNIFARGRGWALERRTRTYGWSVSLVRQPAPEKR